MAPSHSLTFVVKLSKLCNLRCRYCYEFSQLANKDRIEGQDMVAMLRFIKDYAAHFDARPRIVWHGGEPLAQPLTYWQELQAQVAAVFGAKPPQQLIQTNLFALNADKIEILKMVDYVGVSFDVHPGERLAINGKTSEQQVLANMQQLVEHGISFGCISVLHDQNIDRAETSFDFYNAARIGFRVLPFYRSDNPDQVDTYGLDPDRIVTAYQHLFDLWLTKGSGIAIQPLDQYIRMAIARISDAPRQVYDKARREKVLVIDTTGDAYSVANVYREGFAYGNVFHDTATELIAGPGRAKNLDETAGRLASICQKCPWFGYCDGWYIGEATEYEPSHACLVARPTLDYIADQLAQTAKVPARLRVARRPQEQIDLASFA